MESHGILTGHKCTNPDYARYGLCDTVFKQLVII